MICLVQEPIPWIFWNIHRLKERIRLGQLTESERFGYFFMVFVFVAVLLEWIFVFPEELDINEWDFLIATGNSLAYIVGTCLIYRANGGSEGVDFLGKYFSIGFVVVVRSMLPFILILGGYLTLLESFGEYTGATTMIEALIVLGWNVILHWRTWVHVRAVGMTSLNPDEIG